MEQIWSWEGKLLAWAVLTDFETSWVSSIPQVVPLVSAWTLPVYFFNTSVLAQFKSVLGSRQYYFKVPISLFLVYWEAEATWTAWYSRTRTTGRWGVGGEGRGWGWCRRNFNAKTFRGFQKIVSSIFGSTLTNRLYNKSKSERHGKISLTKNHNRRFWYPTVIKRFSCFQCLFFSL